MSAINSKSITGITSITTPSGVDNVFTVHSSDTTERFRVDGSGNQNLSGIITASNFKTGVSNLHNLGLTLSSGQLDIGSNIKAGNAGVITATAFHGSGANLTNLPPSAPVGGASTNQVFFENDKLVEVNYQITSTKNAMSAGPISVSAGIAVTIPSGCSWTIV